METYSAFLAGIAIGITSSFLVKSNKMKDIKCLFDIVLKKRDSCKMVFVVRNDLNMSKGKVAAQCSHAAILCYDKAVKQAPETLRRWNLEGQAKIVVKLDGGEKELQDISEKATSLNIINMTVRDAGLTQVARGTATVLGIGPAPARLIDLASGHLKLM
ncbi:peptidyl-tRNA hydrolase 2, mitochondrial [Nilaparvata lugens]|uniref:peptidyl-tRNA hydrolase 2, mitochondrial n=1 Tax=Nilaparvata lugens TaxID=108931 RepID=UPI000B99072D|nr:peptidyl-tRNA hydrolase 2, mitochondrial [Nilaparvata lugens]XP_039280066.1 peptidyl-tRNA hydrolase 2, mitochondrial [Nilaparvata lugens]XP_039280067.1 peptidyl-tRNA hydrolase 2, mitochondrial [Nilaparvata lugens]XP_039280068.1 peptidyl-tRNA hydrolase 2, mitochondrial [Nilaparvata lugens]